MQSRIVKSVDLFNEFSRVYKIADYNKESQANMILSGNTANFFLIESYGYALAESPEPEFKDYKINSYKSLCADTLYNTILELKQEAAYSLSLITDTLAYRWFKRFIRNEDVEILRSSIANMDKFLNDKSSILNKIDFKYEYLNEMIKIPFYRLHEGQKVYLVIQDPLHFMKVQEGVVKKVKPLETSSDSGTLCDIEFEYDINVNHEISHIPYQPLRSFDGTKCMVNYNYTIFVNIEDAKDNCRKVLNSLKAQIDQQIQIVDNFTGN